MERRALLVGVNDYDNFGSLTGCVLDATAMEGLVSRHYDGSPNYDCRLLTTAKERITRERLREVWEQLFDSFPDSILFYFSGHGGVAKTDEVLATQDGTEKEPGLPMGELLALANESKAREVLLILDCCYSGALGNPRALRENHTQLREGVTILTACRSNEVSLEETGGHGIFTWLVLNALRGGAADVRGRVSAAGIYAYAEQALGSWDQRPLYKSHADRLSPIRRCEPAVTDDLLRELPKFFNDPTDRYDLDPSYESTDPSAIPEHTAIYQRFTRYRDARLLRTVSGDHLYNTTVQSGAVELTDLGQLYWLLAKAGRI